MSIIVEITKEIDKYNKSIDLENVKDYIKAVVEEEYTNINKDKNKDLYLSLLLTDDKNIKIINKNYRGKDKFTDVISFAYLETEGDFSIGPYITIGDIIISMERVEEKSKEYGHDFKREFYYVLTHGILHLLGYDHLNELDKKLMREKEEEILIKHGYTR